MGGSSLRQRFQFGICLKTKVHQQYGFVSGKSTHANRLATIKQVYEQDRELIDPHTADGVKVAREVREAGETIVCLETALAAKFEATHP